MYDLSGTHPQYGVAMRTIAAHLLSYESCSDSALHIRVVDATLRWEVGRRQDQMIEFLKSVQYQNFSGVTAF